MTFRSIQSRCCGRMGVDVLLNMVFSWPTIQPLSGLYPKCTTKYRYVSSHLSARNWLVTHPKDSSSVPQPPLIPAVGFNSERRTPWNSQGKSRVPAHLNIDMQESLQSGRVMAEEHYVISEG